MNDVADEIDAALLRLSNSTTARLREIRRSFSRQLKGASGREVIAAAIDLRERGGLGRHFIACELIRHHPAALSSLGGRDLDRLGKGLDSWAAVDCFACHLSGPAWRLGRITESWIRDWARSTDRWKRRAALVSTVPRTPGLMEVRGIHGEPSGSAPCWSLIGTTWSSRRCRGRYAS